MSQVARKSEAPALVRVASFTAGPSATALDGRPDRIDADPGFGRAVEDLARLRRLIAWLFGRK